MDVIEAHKRVKKFERTWRRKCAQIFKENKGIILELQKSQLLSGRDKNLNLLSPAYNIDPFFKTPFSAKTYITKKILLESQHERLKKYNLFGMKPTLTPNLRVTGEFQNMLKVEVDSNGTLSINSTWSRAPKVIQKYPTALGLSNTAFAYFWNKYVVPDLQDYWNNLR